MLSKSSTNLPKTIKMLPKTSKILPNWRNIAKSGRTRNCSKRTYFTNAAQSCNGPGEAGRPSGGRVLEAVEDVLPRQQEQQEDGVPQGE